MMSSRTTSRAASQMLWEAGKRHVSESNKQRCSSILRLAPAPAPAPAIRLSISMRDRSKNRKALQKGRNLSVEGIQAVQALKRAGGSGSVEAAVESRFRRLLKLDMMAVLRELLRQNQSYLALKVFEEIQREWWYKPKMSLYAEVVSHLGRNGLIEEIKLVFQGLKQQQQQLSADDIEGFNALLTSLLDFNLTALAIDCMYLMKSIGCDLNKSSFHILVDGFESSGEPALSALLRLHAHKLYPEEL